jgi:hypothetical protein
MLANMNGRLALALAAAGAAWPSLHCALNAAMRSPLERALNAAWCGAPQPALNHGSACWLSASALFVAAAVLLAPQRLRVGWGARIRT